MPKPGFRFRLLSLLAMPVVVGVGMSVWIIYAPAVPIDSDHHVADAPPDFFETSVQ